MALTVDDADDSVPALPPIRFDGRVETALRGGLCLSAEAATNLYIDGFNLHYRALKDTPFRWLDLHKLAETLLQKLAAI